MPALAGRQPTGGYLFYDCQTDDARLVLTVLGEAERFGAICANRAQVTALRAGRDGATVISLRDGGGGDRLEAAGRQRDQRDRRVGRPDRARRVALRGRTAADRAQPRHPPAAVHERLPLRAGAIVPVGDGRSIFALPWLGRSLVGTTDETYEGEIEHVQPSPHDVEYLLGAVNDVLRLCACAAPISPGPTPASGR